MKSPSTKPVPTSSESPPEILEFPTGPTASTWEEQSSLVKDWESRPGQQSWGTASVHLQDLKKPMTQESFLDLEGLGGYDLKDRDLIESLMVQGLLPPWFLLLPME